MITMSVDSDRREMRKRRKKLIKFFHILILTLPLLSLSLFIVFSLRRRRRAAWKDQICALKSSEGRPMDSSTAKQLHGTFFSHPFMRGNIDRMYVSSLPRTVITCGKFWRRCAIVTRTTSYIETFDRLVHCWRP
jgi:hypothetical protein